MLLNNFYNMIKICVKFTLEVFMVSLLLHLDLYINIIISLYTVQGLCIHMCYKS